MIIRVNESPDLCHLRITEFKKFLLQLHMKLWPFGNCRR